MATISASLVKDLREKTGAGMMDCKNALTETSGDIEAAVDWLRKKGLSKAAKKGDRVAAEGLIAVAVEGTHAVAVELNSETDFVARNEDFQSLARNIAQVALGKSSDDVEAIKQAAYPAGGTVEAAITNAIATIGENMNLRRAAKLEVSKGAIGQYVHGQISEGLGKIGVLVALESDKDAATLEALGRKIAQHIAATSPLALESSEIPADVIEREKAVLAEKNAAGKPANVVEKIVEGGLKTFFKENCLVDQLSIHEDHQKKTIGQVAKEAGAEIKGFVRFALGEGVEKAEGPDFASEVAAAAGL